MISSTFTVGGILGFLYLEQISEWCFLISLISTIVGYITCRNNKIIKITFWAYMAFLILFILVVIVIIIIFGNAIANGDFDGLANIGYIFN